VEDFIIYSAATESKIYYTNLILIVNSSVATGFAIILVLRQKFEVHHGKTHLALAMGLGLWLSANIIWTLYENVLHIVPPVPSYADFFWLSAYPFFAYYLYKTYNVFRKQFSNTRVLVMSLICGTVFVSCIIPLTINLSVLSSERGIAMFSVMLAYPILNTILLVPVTTMLINFRNEKKCVLHATSLWDRLA
jgi:hypothetical protein